MSYSWLAYLPPHLAADLLAHPTVSPLERVVRTQAVALFADISGFTPMSEALGQVGPGGTEELSLILNRTFSAMIERITAYGGNIGKFAGDALTVLFPTTTRTCRTTLRRAIQCALEMQADLAATPSIATSAGSFSLAMKIGIGMGTLLTTSVGDPAIRLEYLLAGSAIDACAAAEQHAPNGAVVLAASLLPLAGGVTATPLDVGYATVSRLHRRPAAAPTVSLRHPSPALAATLSRYLPPAIAQRVATNQQGFIDEHRLVTTLFVRFDGFDYHDRTVLTRLQPYLAAVVQLIERYGGYLRQVDVGDKGSLYIVLFGAPLAHEDDTERALLCALELRALAQQHHVTTATGITSGRIFCGLVGSARRREYAAIGDSVNLAARLMSAAAPEQILVDAATRQVATRSFHWQELAPLRVKGKTALVEVAALAQHNQRHATRLKAPSYTLPMVGRAQEYTIGLQCIERVVAGTGQVLLLTAEAGMGKSRLVVELMRSQAAKQLRAIPSECLSYAITTSYLVWQHLLRVLFDLVPTMAVEEQMAHVKRDLHAIDPVLLERLPLLGPILNLPFAETPFTQGLAPKVRKSATEALIGACLRYWAQQRPLLLILEDCHWIDELSEELLLAVAYACRDVPLLLLLTRRPPEGIATASYIPSARFRHIAQLQELRLQEFHEAETTELIQLKLAQLFGEQGAIPLTLLERISAQAQGNPFYIDELLNLIYDRQIDVHDAQALTQLELPNSLQRLILSRIDMLEEGPKTALKVGSIIGRLFKAHWLWAIYPTLGEAARVDRYMTMLQQADLTMLERAEPEKEYLFKHIITRDVAYESLALQTRSVLHEQVGHFIEQTYGAGLEGWLDVLAYHYGHSSNVDKQREYFAKAGYAAQAAYANEVAISYFERLLPLLPEAEQGSVLLALAHIHKLLWRRDAAIAHALAARDLAAKQGDQLLESQALLAYSKLLRDAGQYEQALNVLAPAHQTFSELGAQQELVNSFIAVCDVQRDRGQFAEMIATAEQCLELATAIDDQTSRCHVLNNLGDVARMQGRFQDALTFFGQALTIAEACQFPAERAVSTSILGSTLCEMGDYHRADGHHRRALELFLTLGDMRNTMIMLGNLGASYYHMGQYVQAQQCYQAALARTQYLDPYLMGWICNNLARVMGRLGERSLMEQFFARAIAINRTFSIRIWILDGLYHWAEYSVRFGEYGAAQRLNDEAVALANELQSHSYSFLSCLLAIRLRVLLGQLEPPAALEQLEALRTEQLEPQQRALLDYRAWQIDPAHEHARISAAQQYRILYDTFPIIEYHQHYQDLTGENLVPPPPLPAPPPIVEQYHLDLRDFLARIDTFLSEPR